jgi:hypothetical protein
VGSEGATFITKVKNKKDKKKDKRPESPMTRAAKALESMNGAPDHSLSSLAVVPQKKVVDSDSSEDDDEKPLALTMGDGTDKPYYKDIGDRALAECDELENEMNAMFKELDDMQSMIKGN